MAMRLINNRLVACINHSCVVVDVTEPADLKQIDKKIDVIRGGIRSLGDMDPQSEFDIPLIPIEGISTEERIKLSIDLRYRFFSDSGIYKHSIVDIHNGKIAFFYASHEKVTRFEVIRWDQEKAYCKFSAARPFTILETMVWAFSYFRCNTFVKNGKLYVYQQNTLLVFDIRSGRGIRKLGHFVRMEMIIEDIAVMDNGNMLLSTQWLEMVGSGAFKDRKNYLYLLKNPK